MNEEKILKLINVNNFYILFSVVMIGVIFRFKSYLDISYFLLVTFYYMRLKFHQKEVL